MNQGRKQHNLTRIVLEDYVLYPAIVVIQTLYSFTKVVGDVIEELLFSLPV